LCGIGAQAPTKIAASNASGERTMWVVYLEIGLALGLAGFIVWWTWPKPKEKERKRNKDQ
jgi:hypothetical protein